MKRILILVAISFQMASFNFQAQEVEPGTIPWTPVVDTGLVQVAITVPPQFASVGIDPVANAIKIPKGWTAQVFFAGRELDKPRFMAWGPDSVLYVANMSDNNVLALPDEDGDGVADRAVVVTSTSARCHSIAFYKDTLYLAQEAGVTRVWRSDQSSLFYDQREVLIDKSSQPNQTGGNHRTRTIVLDTLNRKIYLSVGSRGNADRETNRATIEVYDWDGSNRRIYADGVRNAVGMTLHPRTGQLWANNNGSDLQGDDVPPEWVDIVRDGGFYGYPVAYNHQMWFDFYAKRIQRPAADHG